MALQVQVSVIGAEASGDERSYLRPSLGVISVVAQVPAPTRLPWGLQRSPKPLQEGIPDFMHQEYCSVFWGLSC